MKVFTIDYSYDSLTNEIYRTKFQDSLKQASNCVYFFFNNDECLYIGQTGNTLYERCYVNTPKHCDKDFFKESNMIHIIVLDEVIDQISRETIEAVLIQSYRPLYNKKG